MTIEHGLPPGYDVFRLGLNEWRITRPIGPDLGNYCSRVKAYDEAWTDFIPPGYWVRQMPDGDGWEFFLIDDEGNPLEYGESDDSYEYRQSAIIAARADYEKEHPPAECKESEKPPAWEPGDQCVLASGPASRILEIVAVSDGSAWVRESNGQGEIVSLPDISKPNTRDAAAAEMRKVFYAPGGNVEAIYDAIMDGGISGVGPLLSPKEKARIGARALRGVAATMSRLVDISKEELYRKADELEAEAQQ